MRLRGRCAAEWLRPPLGLCSRAPRVCLLLPQAFTPPPSLQPGAVSAAAYVPAAGVTGAEDDRKSRFVSLVRAYQVRGHRLSNLDPLGLTKRPTFPELDFRTYISAALPAFCAAAADAAHASAAVARARTAPVCARPP